MSYGQYGWPSLELVVKIRECGIHGFVFFRNKKHVNLRSTAETRDARGLQPQRLCPVLYRSLLAHTSNSRISAHDHLLQICKLHTEDLCVGEAI